LIEHKEEKSQQVAKTGKRTTGIYGSVIYDRGAKNPHCSPWKPGVATEVKGLCLPRGLGTSQFGS